MLPTEKLKVIRKWRDRAYMLGQRFLDLCVVRGRKRILFWPGWQNCEDTLRRAFRHSPHEVFFAEIPPGGGDYDLIVPLSPDDLIAAARDERLCRRNPLPIPDPAAVELCEDKAAFNARMRELGFGRHIPRDVGPGEFPYVLKLRRDSCARNAFLINGPADEAEHQERVHSPDYVRQECVLGEMEYTDHLLLMDGRVRRVISFSFWMAADRSLKGRDHVRLMRRRSDSRHVPLFEAMLRGIGFNGLCCVNYKLRDGVPMVFEINPRFGNSLGPFFPALLRSLDWDRTGRR